MCIKKVIECIKLLVGLYICMYIMLLVLIKGRYGNLVDFLCIFVEFIINIGIVVILVILNGIVLIFL